MVMMMLTFGKHYPSVLFTLYCFLSANTFYGKASENTTLVDGDFDTYVEDNNIPPYISVEFQTIFELRQVDLTLELGR